MTGRRLYDHFTDASKKRDDAWHNTVLPGSKNGAPLAWAYLAVGDRYLWNELARRITPKRKRASS